jgi:hypothetical protein
MAALPNRHAVEVGVLVAFGDFLIFQHFMPPVADVRAADQFNPLAEGSERTALLVATAFTVLVSGFVRSFDTFIIAGAAVVMMDFAFKHAVAVHPETGTMQGPSGGSMEGGNVHPLPSYEDVAQ